VNNDFVESRVDDTEGVDAVRGIDQLKYCEF